MAATRGEYEEGAAANPGHLRSYGAFTNGTDNRPEPLKCAANLPKPGAASDGPGPAPVQYAA